MAGPALEDADSHGSIQFRTANLARRADPQIRTLYNGGAASSPQPRNVSFTAAKMPVTYSTPAAEMPTARKASLVRPEEYMPPVPRVGSNFNPYFSPVRPLYRAQGPAAY
jgi:hypothetical protein